MRKSFTRSLVISAGMIFSGLCWYISNGLNGDYWYLLWIAPVPVLLVSFHTTARRAFFIAFIAYLIGRLSWFTYLRSVATIIPAIIATIALPLIFAVIVLLTRWVVNRLNAWYAVFAFPAFFTTYEWLLTTFSYDGTASSIAYSQSDFLPLIQIAAITGILGITFMVTFIPSAMALAWQFRNNKKQLGRLIIVSFLLTGSILLYGVLRMTHENTPDKISVALVALDETQHHMPPLDAQHELQHTRNYANEIGRLATQGAKLVVLPERAIIINRETDTATTNLLCNTAKQFHVAIITGYTNFKNEPAQNSALVISDQGVVLQDYDKIHLVKGFEDQFARGNQPGLFILNGILAGTAICKDLDYPEYIIQYRRSGVHFLAIPAWDFTVDDWLHARMAILRGVENGFWEIRTARLGRLTVSDVYGAVQAEASAANGKTTRLMAYISPGYINTFYTQYGGNWPGWLSTLAGAAFILSIIIRKKSNHTSKRSITKNNHTSSI